MDLKPIFQHEDTSYLFGCNIGTGEKISDTIRELSHTPLRGCQIGSDFSLKKVSDYIETKSVLRRENKYGYVHCPFITNLAGRSNGVEDWSFLERSREITSQNLDYCSLLGMPYIQHVGSNSKREMGLQNVIRSINDVLLRDSKITKKLEKSSGQNIKAGRKIVLENSAGQGNYLGNTLDELQQIYMSVKPELRSQISFCIDTAHIFSAGEYDFGMVEEIDQFYQDFDEKIGLDKLECFHFNDSKVEKESRVDRHQYIGKGYIFDEKSEERKAGLSEFVEKARENGIPFIYEPPSSKKMGRAEIVTDAWMLLRQCCNIESCWC